MGWIGEAGVGGSSGVGREEVQPEADQTGGRVPGHGESLSTRQQGCKFPPSEHQRFLRHPDPSLKYPAYLHPRQQELRCSEKGLLINNKATPLPLALWIPRVSENLVPGTKDADQIYVPYCITISQFLPGPLAPAQHQGVCASFPSFFTCKFSPIRRSPPLFCYMLVCLLLIYHIKWFETADPYPSEKHIY